jgi:hypothetical protein
MKRNGKDEDLSLIGAFNLGNDYLALGSTSGLPSYVIKTKPQSAPEVKVLSANPKVPAGIKINW